MNYYNNYKTTKTICSASADDAMSGIVMGIVIVAMLLLFLAFKIPSKAKEAEEPAEAAVTTEAVVTTISE